MPRGPKGEKCPADVIGNAIKIATSEEQETCEAKRPKDEAAASLGRGGKARAERMSPERRVEIAKKAAESCWSQRR